LLSQRLGRLAVPQRLLAMPAAHALFTDRLLGREHFQTPYVAAGLCVLGADLLRIWDETPGDPVHDRALIDHWAALLGLQGWYRWKPYEP
jgi:hypothetical protein